MREETHCALAEHTAADIDTTASTQQEKLHAAQTAAQVAMALGALDKHYKENIAAYARELHEADKQIELAKTELSAAYEQKKPYVEALVKVQQDIDHELRMLEHQTQIFIQDTKLIRELEKELASLEKIDQMQARIAFRKESLQELENEIEVLELTLLNHELEKENLLIRIEPIEQKIRLFEKEIADLEAHKRYIESAHLHRVGLIGQSAAPRTG